MAPLPRKKQNRGEAETAAQVLEDLKPQLRDLYSKLPQQMTSRIDGLLKRLPDVRIDPNRLLKYAVLFVAAERDISGAAVSRDHTGRARAELAGQHLGFEEGYEQSEEAWRRYRRGRQARQRIQASVEGVRTRWRKAEDVIRKQRRNLPIHARAGVSEVNLKAVASALDQMHRSMALGEAYPPKAASGGREFTPSMHTYLLWHRIMPNYKGKWRDMHELAAAWKLTKCQGTDSFRLIVLKSADAVEHVPVPFGSTWMAAFSEDP